MNQSEYAKCIIRDWEFNKGQYTIIYKYGKRTRQLQETMAAGEHRFAPELNEILENATPGSINKATKYNMKVF